MPELRFRQPRTGRPAGAAELVLAVRGNLGRSGLVVLQDYCAHAISTGATALRLDFTAMTDCPSALLAVLSRVNATLQARGGRLELVGLHDAVLAIAGRDRP